MKSSKKSPVLWPTTLYGQCWLLWFLITTGNLLPSVYSEVLTPPYFNIAENRRITATATCGDEGQERYCKLVGANSETGVGNNIINGQDCAFCDMSNPAESHPPQYAIDGSERWWQSPPLSRGTKYNEVNLTIDLGQEFHVAYVFITMANSPRPGVWILERSTDNGKTWKPWQYFAENPADCDQFFRTTLQQITHDDSVICDTTFSKVVPLEHGEIVISLLNQRPSAVDFFSSDVLQEWTRATNIRLKLLRTTTLKGQLMSVVHGDTTVTRRYFYSIKDISIGGRCRCNGHADLCDITDPNDSYKLLCRCQHNTCGAQCEKCCPGYVQKAWRPATYSVPFVCEQCNCHGHSNDCFYDEEADRNKTSLDINNSYDGGGVCINCQDNTEGTNCDKCVAGYYRPYGKDLMARDVCQPCQCNYFFATGNCEEGSGRCECRKEFQEPNCDSCSTGYYDYPNCKPCDCHLNGTRGEVCEVGGGQCPCKTNFAGKNCDKCADGYYNFPDCLSCSCDEPGSVHLICDANGGQCECDNKFGGRRCDQCENGYYDFPTCTYCSCDVRGTRDGICDQSSGECLCREGYGGDRCDQCLPEFFGYPDCKPCNCSTKGSIGKICDVSGKCPCLHNFGGRTCDQCKPGFYLFPECLPCNCSTEGSIGVSCDDGGKCQCKANFDGLQCEKCREGFYNHPRCEECNCDPAGIIESFKSCADAPKGTLCVCKERVNGSICNECKPLYWNLQQWNPRGCDECDCHTPGVIGGVQVCDGKSGQCPCKSHLTTQKCEECADGFYNLTAENLFGCKDCGCDVGGAVNTVCDKMSGQCICRPRIEGTQCTQPLQTHYYPTMYQFIKEAEDGKTPSRGDVRIGYDEYTFPDYSWRGYAIFNELQPETIYDMYIDKSSLYRVVMRYQNPGETPLPIEIKAIPESASDEEQSAKVKLEPRQTFTTISKNNLPQPFVLNPGRWRFHIISHQYLLIDYFVLLPQAYYEGSILQKQVNEPCMINITAKGKSNNIIPDPCVKLRYPSTNKFDNVMLSDGYVDDDGDRIDLSQFYKDKKVLKSLGLNTDRVAVISPQQKEISLEFPASKGGRYMLLLEYFTPMGANVTTLEVEATSNKGSTNGKVLIHDCKLATACRQVVTTDQGEVAVFKFDKNNINLVVEAPEEISDKIAIHSIIAVPYGKWSLDYIRPEEYCVVRNGTCVPSTYEIPPDSTKVEAEAADPDRIAPEDSLPEGVPGDRTLVYLHDKERNVSISGRVPTPGLYTFLVHYHQPDNPGFSVGVDLQNGQYYEAKLPIVHCPSTVGCRAIIQQPDKNQQFYIEDDFNIILKSPQNVWVDYVLAVPNNANELNMNMKMDMMDGHVSRYLKPSQLDETSKFIAECGKNHFHLPSNASDFCKAATFSLTSEYNNGALPCQCHIPGSTSFECEPFGGQCECRENVIGRRCERCKTGYYGYPDCKPCDCPASALCDDRTGECVCAPRVTGAKCDACAPMTYGFDAMIGCLECECHAPGVVNGNLQCDLQNGQCDCKPNIVGRTCDKCKPGHWAMPYCQLCECDLRGTTEDICNQDTSGCFCKINVEGRPCDTCKTGSFNLQEQNAAGCTKCFCFSKTAKCESAYLFWTQVTAVKDQWTAISFDPIKTYSPVIGYEIEFEDYGQQTAFLPIYIPEDTTPEGNETNVLYFKADIEANHLASYGGLISYHLTSDPDSDEQRDTYAGPDVILESRELSPSSGIVRLMHYSIEHLDGDNAMRMKLPLLEENFVVISATGGFVAPTREQMMIALKDLRAIYIRAGYWKKTREVKLSDFGIEIGTEDHVYPTPENRALTIEQCQCPPNYKGLSCEECADGYFRSPTGPYGGFCVPCQCNGHSDTCDPVSGICHDCRHNTTGDHCENCEAGYHGDATQGKPYDCLICACPLPMISNNFATSCELNGPEISCVCKDEYFGNRCEGCGPGYYGRPEIPGDYCKPCDCSGNIDVSDPYSCDTVTGRCLKCLNHTSGQLCEYCQPGYFGDAVISKTCNQCSCNVCGTRECDHTTGDCQCLHNVIGVNCDLCAPDHYGMARCDGTGCYSCDCSIASVNSQCDDTNGQCECRPGTTGRRCERCAPGYWNYTAEGCQPCECNQDYAIGVGCNPETGQCSCLPGVVGEKCDRCPYRWVLIEDRGCQECDSCQHQILDDTDAMAADLDPVKDDFDSVALSYFTTQKLAYYNDTAARLEPEVRLLDPERVDLTPYSSSVSNLEMDAALSRQKGEITAESLQEKLKQSLALKDKSFEMEGKVQEAVARAQTAVYETKDLMEGLLAEDRLSSPQTDAARGEADAIINDMQGVKFDPTAAQVENKTAAEVLQNVEKFVEPINALTQELSDEGVKLKDVRDKLKDLRNQSDYSIDTSRSANDIMDKIKEAKFPVKVAVLENRANNMMDNIENASLTNGLTERLIDDLDNSYLSLDAAHRSVDELQVPLEQKSDTLKNALENYQDSIGLSRRHAQNLQREADRLDNMLTDTRAVSENAVAAATAYKNIVDALSEALNAADKAKMSADNTTSITNGIGEEALSKVEPSHNLVVLANDNKDNVEQILRIPLKDSKRLIEDIEKTNEDTVNNLRDINKKLNELENEAGFGDIGESVRVSSEASQRANSLQGNVDEILNTLPDQSNSVRRLAVTVNDLNQNVDISDNQLNKAKEDIPLSSAITGSLEAKKPMFEEKKNDLAERLADLKAKIAAAREQANRVHVGMNLHESSSLLLANPESLESQQAETQMSIHFKTNEPDGLLLYLGNEPGRKEDDFMAIEIDRGYPILTMDLGSGPQRIPNEKYVADDQWYKATVKRAGKNVRFTISEEDSYGNVLETNKDEYLGGGKSLFNVNKNSSRLYVGGLPPGQARNPVKYSSFRGVVEDLKIGEEKVGLWNFKDSQNLQPAYERDKLVNLKVETGLRFLGNGYAILNRTLYSFKQRSAIQLKFQTRAKSGLIFLVGRGRKYLSIEMNNGAVAFQYDLGGGPARLLSRGTFNDGNWHVLEAVRDGKRSALHVDGKNEASGVSAGSQTTLSVSDYMYFGGYPGDHGFGDVTSKDFEGCISDVNIDSIPVYLSEAVETRYTVLGCPSSRFEPSVASFYGQGYIQVPTAAQPVDGPEIVTQQDDTFEVNLRVRTNSSDGLVLYGTDRDQSNYLSVSLLGGALHVRTEPGPSEIVTDPLNDANWHAVTITRDRGNLAVNIDDMHEFSQPASGGPLSLTSEGSVLFLGGRPDDFQPRGDSGASDQKYSGCLADINVNGKRIDFSDSNVEQSSLTQTCLTLQDKMAIQDESNRNGRTIPKVDDSDEDGGGSDVLIEKTTETPAPQPLPSLPTEEEEKEDGSDWDGDLVDPDEDEEIEEVPPPKKQKKEPEEKPKPFAQCALPYRLTPDEDEDVSLDEGVRFGNLDKTSRMEFFQQKDDGVRSTYSIEFKTSSPDGLIFMWTVFDKIDFVALYMKKGLLHFAFDSGSGPAYLNSTKMYNDSEWHSAVFTRFRTTGDLTVDGMLVVTGNSSGSTTNVDAGTVVYIGGLPIDAWGKRMTMKKIHSVDTPFRGCLRNFMLRNKSPGAPLLTQSVQPCSADVENGMYFYPNLGYLKLQDRYKVGRNIKLSLSIKPRHPSGILVSVHGERDFMVLQMINGTIKFTVDNGKGPLSSSFTKDPYDLCDGNWHNIRVTKSKNVVTLALDNTYSSPGIGHAGKDSTNTNHPLYLGGHPNPSSARGFETTEQYVGCMKDFVVENKQFKFNHEGIEGVVGLHSCPVD